MQLSCRNRGSTREQHSQQNNSNQSRVRDNKAKAAQVQLGKATETIRQVVATGSLRGSTDRVSEINKISLELGVCRIGRCRSIRIDKDKATKTISSQAMATGSLRGSPDQVKEINKILLELVVYRID